MTVAAAAAVVIVVVVVVVVAAVVVAVVAVWGWKLPFSLKDGMLRCPFHGMILAAAEALLQFLNCL